MKSRLLNIGLNGVWQMFPAITSVLISLIVVREFSAAIWGEIVSVLIIQQILNGVLTWGSKDYLQKNIAERYKEFDGIFSRLFIERMFLMGFAISMLYLLGLLKHPLVLSLLIFGQFIRQSFDALVLQKRNFSPFIVWDGAVLVLQIAALFSSSSISDILLVLALGAALGGALPVFLFWPSLKFDWTPDWQLKASAPLAFIAIAGMMASRIDVLVFKEILASETDVLGQYQVYVSFGWAIQATAAYIASPYVPHFYRLGTAPRNQVVRRYLTMGFVIVPALAFLVHGALVYLFKFNFDWRTIPLMFIIGLNAYILTPIVYRLYAAGKEFVVASIISSAVVVYPILAYMIDPFITWDVFSAFAYTAMHNCVLLAFLSAYHRINLKPTK